MGTGRRSFVRASATSATRRSGRRDPFRDESCRSYPVGSRQTHTAKNQGALVQSTFFLAATSSPRGRFSPSAFRVHARLERPCVTGCAPPHVVVTQSRAALETHKSARDVRSR